MSDDGEDIIKKVCEYFFDDDFANTIENWAKQHCDIFDEDIDEHKLEYTELYHEYQALFEDKIGEFLAKEGVEIEEFYAYCKEVEEHSHNDAFIQILLATSEYDVFCTLMTEVKKQEMMKAGAYD